MFGEEDVLVERPYTTSVTCMSNTGSCYAMKSSEFFRKLKGNEESWKAIKRYSKTKEKDLLARIKKIDEVKSNEINKT